MPPQTGSQVYLMGAIPQLNFSLSTCQVDKTSTVYQEKDLHTILNLLEKNESKRQHVYSIYFCCMLDVIYLSFVFSM